MTSKLRKTSALARVRGIVTVADLVVVGFVALGDEVLYEYQGRKFRATITAGGYLVAERDLAGSPSRVGWTAAKLPMYVKPTNWTEDCIAAYNAENGKKVRTRASPYSRITLADRSSPDGRITLQALRERYIQKFADLSPVQTPDAVREAVRRRLSRLGNDSLDGASQSSASSSSSLDLSTPRADQRSRYDYVSVQGLRAEMRTKSYREMCFELERRHNSVSQKLHQTQAALLAEHDCLEAAKKCGFSFVLSNQHMEIVRDCARRVRESSTATSTRLQRPPINYRVMSGRKRQRVSAFDEMSMTPERDEGSERFDTTADHNLFSGLICEK